MEEKTDRLYARVTPAEKKRIAGLAQHCGLSQAEYIRKRALGFAPRPALSKDFYKLYYQLCDFCNKPLSPDVEDGLLALIGDIRDELILPGKQFQKEIKGDPAKPALWGEEDPRSAEPLGACAKSEGRRVI